MEKKWKLQEVDRQKYIFSAIYVRFLNNTRILQLFSRQSSTFDSTQGDSDPFKPQPCADGTKKRVHIYFTKVFWLYCVAKLCKSNVSRI